MTQQYSWLGALLVALAVAGVASAEFPEPPPEIRQKIKAVEAACKKELNGKTGPQAFMQLLRAKDENPSSLSEKCLEAADKLPPPPRQ